MSIQAHTDALAVLADKAVTVTSSADSVEILAQQNIVLHGGDSMIRLEGNAVTFETSGLLSVKGAGHPLVGPEGAAASLPIFPQIQLGPYKGKLNLVDQHEKPIADCVYKVVSPTGKTLAQGITDQSGSSIVVATDEGPNATAYIGQGDWIISEEVLSDSSESCC